MKIRVWTSEEEQWLKENYATTTDNACKAYLKTTFQQIWIKADELGLKKDKPTDFEKARTLAKKASKKCLHQDEVFLNYCMDCIHYQPGGVCKKTKKDVGALWMKKCFNGEVILPNMNLNSDNTMETIKTKRCSKCGRELPQDQFGKHNGNKDGLQRWCRECMNESLKKNKAEKKAQKATQPKKEVAKPTPVVEVEQTQPEIQEEVSYKGLVDDISRDPARRAAMALKDMVGEKPFLMWQSMNNLYEDMIVLYELDNMTK